MSEKNKPSYWAVLPASVRYDPKLPPTAKLLYAELSALADATGYCFAYNEYFEKNFEWSERSIQRLLKALEGRGYISIDVIRDEQTNAVIERRVYAGINPAGKIAPPSRQNCRDPSRQNCQDPSRQNCRDPSRQNCQDPSRQNCRVEQLNNIHNTPPTPQGGKGARRRKEPREAPDWKPDRFAGFWKFYPKQGRKNKQDAMDAWDKLRPDDDLIDRIARALVKLKATELWQREIGIPYVATFLRNARWVDADELDAPDSSSGGGWADDEEVL